jgi:hypothetical protein
MFFFFHIWYLYIENVSIVFVLFDFNIILTIVKILFFLEIITLHLLLSLLSII